VLSDVDAVRLRSLVREVADFPVAGIGFKDVFPLLADPGAFATVIDAFARAFDDERIDVVLGIESRGFILAAPLAAHFGAAFVPARKAGKLPPPTRTVSYELEYGQATLEMAADVLQAGNRVLILDDLLATGGTAAATASLVEQLGADVAGFGFVIELGFLGGGARIEQHRRVSLLDYDG
jgi:adenine phosphoribosyltransferase